MPKGTTVVRRAFADGEILTASDVNAGLNPATAPHIPYAVFATTAVVVFNNVAAANVVVNFPPGRFTTPPMVCANVSTEIPAPGIYTHYGVIVSSITAASCSVRLQITGNITGSINVSLIAVQMDY